MEADILLGGKELAGYGDNADDRSRNAEMIEEDLGGPLIDEDAAVLRVAEELSDVVEAVVTSEQVGLSAPRMRRSNRLAFTGIQIPG